MADTCILSDEEASISGELTRHQRSQEEEELFTQSGKLKIDNMSHSGKNLFVCTHCDKAFNMSALKRHKFVLAKLFACTLCTYYASSLSDLKKHNLTHTGEKLFSCKKMS